MEIMMRAVIAFQLTIGKRENPFRLSWAYSLKKNVYLFYKRVDYHIKFRSIYFRKTQQFNSCVFIDLNLHVLYREKSFKPFYLAHNTAV